MTNGREALGRFARQDGQPGASSLLPLDPLSQLEPALLRRFLLRAQLVEQRGQASELVRVAGVEGGVGQGVLAFGDSGFELLDARREQVVVALVPVGELGALRRVRAAARS